MWKKGQSGNPAGRKKGTIEELKRYSLEIRELASKDATATYEKLKKAINLGEAWAFQLFFKELVVFQNAWLKEARLGDIDVKVTTTEDRNRLISELTDRLLKVDALTVDEILNVIKTLNSINFAELLSTKESLIDLLSEDKKTQLMTWILEAKEGKDDK